MDRRAFVAGAVAFFAAPPHAEAQQAAKVPRIAFLTTTSPGDSPTTDAFRRALRELGYVEGQNIRIEWRWGRGSTDRFPDFAAEVAQLKVDLVVAANDAAGRAAQRATRTIPIVIAIMGDPIGAGFVATFARPGGNITGLTSQGRDVTAKRLQLFNEAFPHLTRLALLADTTDLIYRPALREAEIAGQVLGIQLRPREVGNPTALAGAFAAMIRESSAAVFVLGGTMLYANRAQLAEYALRSRLPMMCAAAEFVEAGCLMSYSASLAEIFRRAATYVDKILRGAKPAELPVEQPTKFELVINLKTAKALGLTIPPSLLLRADHVIE